jgi:GT2 family glycosyltransferase
MLALALDFGRDKIRFEMNCGDAMIYHSRNVIAQKFLETDAKWLLMMDDDIIPCIGRPGWMRHWVQAARNIPDAPLQRHVLHRLVGSGKTLIGGAYFGRQEGGTLMCSNPDLASHAKAYADAAAPVEWVATGCMLVHRKVFEDIQTSFPELAPKNLGDAFDFFHPLSGSEGEDVSFCRRAAKAGHQPHIDLGLPVFHVGYKTY